MNARTIIERLGGIHETARKMSIATGEPVAVSTVQYWAESGFFPPHRQHEISQTIDHFRVRLSKDEKLVVFRIRDRRPYRRRGPDAQPG